MPKQMPATVLAGDTLKLILKSDPYSNADGYSLVVKLNGPTGAPIPYSYTTTLVAGSSNQFTLNVSATDTAAFQPGMFTYAVIATDGTEQYTIESGTFDVKQRADLQSASDLRTHARKVLDAIQAVIEGRATQDQESYTIAGRTLQRTPLRDLLNLRKYYHDLVAKEEGRSRNKLKIRMR